MCASCGQRWTRWGRLGARTLTHKDRCARPPAVHRAVPGRDRGGSGTRAWSAAAGALAPDSVVGDRSAAGWRSGARWPYADRPLPARPRRPAVTPARSGRVLEACAIPGRRSPFRIQLPACRRAQLVCGGRCSPVASGIDGAAVARPWLPGAVLLARSRAVPQARRLFTSWWACETVRLSRSQYAPGWLRSVAGESAASRPSKWTQSNFEQPKFSPVLGVEPVDTVDNLDIEAAARPNPSRLPGV